MFDVVVLKKFYSEISNPAGVGIDDFQNELEFLFSKDRSDQDLNDYRLGRGVWKKLRDEITPVSRFLKFYSPDMDHVRFPLDDKIPDCWLLKDGSKDVGIEVTIERGRERYHRTKEMNETGIGRGFIGVQDDEEQEAFDRHMARPRIMYTTEQALNAVEQGILRCLSRKNDSKYEGVHYLLIQTDLSILSPKNWETIKKELTQETVSLPFQEVHVIGSADEKPYGFQLK